MTEPRTVEDRPDDDGRARPPLGVLVRRFGVLFGPVAAFAVYWATDGSGFDPAGRRTAAVGTLMALWWITEAVPIPVTALLPIVLFPLLGITTLEETTAPYAQPVIFLFLGGFLLGLAMQRWGLHRRVALLVLRGFGTRPPRLVAGFMLAAGVLSMCVSNTATVAMLLPIGLSLLDVVAQERPGDVDEREVRRFSVSLLLGIAYGASIGGLATLIGTPPNLLLAGHVRETFGQELSFADWLRFGLPLVVVLGPVAWWVLTRVVHRTRLREVPGGRELLADEAGRLGPMKQAEILVLAVLAAAGMLWTFRPLLIRWTGVPVDDATIAVGAGLLLFLLPSRSGRAGERLLDWDAAARLPWGVLILFGGGLSLAAAMEENGVAAALAGSLSGLRDLGPLFVVGLVTTIVIFLTELTSNTATAAAFLPVLSALALEMELHPFRLLIPATIAASCAFMLPVATPPNAMVFGSRAVTVRDMATAGLVLNLVAIVAVTLACHYLAGPLLGIDLDVFPEWARQAAQEN